MIFLLLNIKTYEKIHMQEISQLNTSKVNRHIFS